MSEDLLYEIKDGIGCITFNRPRARNAFTFEMYERLALVCKEAEQNPSVRALVLKGTDQKAFASGTDISEFRTISTADEILECEERTDRALGTLERSPIPTIAAIAGVCTGGGAGIAACCDIRIGAANAQFGLPIARTVGNCLSMSNYVRLVSLIGLARVKEVIFTARLIGAPEALTIGLLSEVLPDYAALTGRAFELARTIAKQAPLTLRATKEALRRIKEKITPDDHRDLILSCYMSSDFREGIDAFLAKRTPNWTGT
jgi:enoyl-CoA hydratase